MPSGHAIAALVAHIACAFFTIYPISIPTPRPMPQIKINLTTAPVLAIAVLWASRCIDLTVILTGIIGTGGVRPYGIVILFFSLAYIAASLDITGVVRVAAFWIAERRDSNGWKLYFYFNAVLVLLSMVFGKGTTIHSGTVFLVHYTAVTELDSRAWTVANFAAVNIAGMVLFVGSPINVVVCERFGINSATFTAYTILPFLASYVCCFISLALQYHKQVPRKLHHSFVRKPLQALMDPVGAWVGGFMLISTLVLCVTITSFFDIDAWKISLPIAIAKILFDLGWDYYRYSSGIPMLGRGFPTIVRAPTIENDQPMPTSHSTSSFSSVTDEERPRAVTVSPRETPTADSRSRTEPMNPRPLSSLERMRRTAFIWRWDRSYLDDLHDRLDQRFPTFVIALPRLPFSLILVTFSQFILVEALDHQGWIRVFSDWFLEVTRNQMHPTIWSIGVLAITLCNISGTNIGATILLTRVVHASALQNDVEHGAAIALAVASNIGAVGFTFAASLTGVWWRSILHDEGRPLSQRDFALSNILPLLAMASVGLGVVSAEMAILFGF